MLGDGDNQSWLPARRSDLLLGARQQVFLSPSLALRHPSRIEFRLRFALGGRPQFDFEAGLLEEELENGGRAAFPASIQIHISSSLHRDRSAAERNVSLGL